MAQSYTKTENINYYDDLSNWVLGQTSSMTVDNVVVSEVTYNSKAQPSAIRSYGKLQQTISYNPDGTVETVRDGNNNATSFNAWKRGVPQFVMNADGTSKAAVVDDNGWILSVRDENGFSTNYTYDAMGRLASTSYPTADNTAWNTSIQNFELVNAAEYDIAAGHWRQTLATGNARKITYFDALWRPVITREYDAADESGTQRFQRFDYDHEGRLTFSSYPGASPSLSAGARMTYDALGRPTAVSQDSELGVLTVVTEYLSGNKTRTTNARGQQTVTAYQSFDQPSYDKPVSIQHPEGTNTEISRDVFGNPMSIVRRSADSAQVLTRTYSYNANRELCRVVEPETGATLTGYDAAGNLKWSAAGLPSDTPCESDGSSSTVAARRVDRSYDGRKRIVALNFPDGNGNERWAYWPDSQIKQITTVNEGIASYNSYSYNKRRLLVAESAGQADGESWAMGYSYDGNGHLAAHRYPSGQTIEYSPNALGQVTRAGSYAANVSYYPNGAIKQFTYGNGIVHTLSQNARQLPDVSQDTYAGFSFLNDGYDYDGNGNVAAISDGATGRGQRGNRTMAYDGLDRLSSTVSPMFGTASYGYDALDNLTRVAAPGRDHYYCYDPYWHLTNIKTNGCSGSTVIGLGYDMQGNLINKNGQGFAFDYGNRLRSAVGKETYRYDGHGRRIQALQNSGAIGSMYDLAGVLRYQKDQRQSKATDYIMLGGSLVAEAEWLFGQMPPAKDYLDWTAVGGATRYVVEESVDGVTWAAVYEGNELHWTSLSRPTGTYSYRVLACTGAGECTAATNVTHVQRPVSNIVPLLYQLLLN